MLPDHAVVKTIVLYSLAGGVIVGVGALLLHSVGIDVFPGVAGIGAGIGAAVGMQKAVSAA